MLSPITAACSPGQTSLQDGSPLEGVTIRSDNTGSGTLTGPDGLAAFPILSGASFLTAQSGIDTALLPRSPYAWADDSWQAFPPADELRWYVFDDRKLYRPGEEVHVKGWIRQIGGSQKGDVGLAGENLRAVSYTVTDSQGK